MRELLFSGHYGLKGSELYSLVEDWLASKESERKAALDTRSEARADESLSIARGANLLSRKALFNSRMANAIAIIALMLSIIIAIIQWYSKL